MSSVEILLVQATKIKHSKPEATLSNTCIFDCSEIFRSSWGLRAQRNNAIGSIFSHFVSSAIRCSSICEPKDTQIQQHVGSLRFDCERVHDLVRRRPSENFNFGKNVLFTFCACRPGNSQAN